MKKYCILLIGQFFYVYIKLLNNVYISIIKYLMAMSYLRGFVLIFFLCIGYAVAQGNSGSDHTVF